MNYAIILSGGIGSRMGLNRPKQYVETDGRPIISHCLAAFARNARTDAIIIGLEDAWRAYVEQTVSHLHIAKPVYYAPAGETRQYTIYHCLLKAKEAGAKSGDTVIIHDAARPLLKDQLINACYEACREGDGVLPVLPVKDTIYYSADGSHIDRLMERDKLWSGQAPEAFVFGKYLEAHNKTPRERLLTIKGSTEIAFLHGMNIKLIPGDPMNFKITTPEDLSNFISILHDK